MAGVVMVLSVLDSYTTHLCFKQYPDKELKGEGNPIMRRLMLKNRVLAEVFKHGFTFAICIWLVITNEMDTIRLLALALGLVVLNNAFVVVSRAITKRKVATPAERLRRALHMREKLTYVVAILMVFCLAVIINSVVWG